MSNSAAAALGGAPAAAPAGGDPAGGAAPVAAPASGAPAAPATPANGEWFSSITDEPTRTWVQAKGWKGSAELAESAYNLEKLIGHEKAGRTVVIPGDDAKPEDVAAFRAKMGVPANAADYKLPVPDGASTEFATEAAKWFHETGVPPKQAQALTEKWNSFAALQAKADGEKFVQRADQEFTTVVSKWGKDADMNLEAGRRAAAQFIPAANAEARADIMHKIERAVGTQTMLEMFASIGKGLGEHRMVDGGGAGSGVFGMSQEAAKQRITELRSDKAWAASYVQGDKAKLAELENLHKVAYPDSN